MIEAATARQRARRVDALADTAQQALPAAEWRPGAHGADARPRPTDDGAGHRFALSRMGTCPPGGDAIDADATAVDAALGAAGCTTERREFGGGDAVWIVAHRADASVVVKLAANGNRLVSAESPVFTDASPDEVAAALG